MVVILFDCLLSIILTSFMLSRRVFLSTCSQQSMRKLIQVIMSDQPQHPTPPPSASSASPPLAGGPSPSALAPPAVFYSVPTATRRSVQTEKLVASSSSSNHNYGPANVVVEKSGLKVLFYKSRTRPGLTLRFPWASERGGMQHFKCDGCQKGEEARYSGVLS